MFADPSALDENNRNDFLNVRLYRTINQLLARQGHGI